MSDHEEQAAAVTDQGEAGTKPETEDVVEGEPGWTARDDADDAPEAAGQ